MKWKSIRIPENVYWSLKELALKNRTSISKMFVELFNSYKNKKS